ncbi:hypothetical protein TRVL_00884 [Trypanosoma vivax]|nr:hypothetical protein TRVL_00884 [Trypanosoma vivax]
MWTNVKPLLKLKKVSCGGFEDIRVKSAEEMSIGTSTRAYVGGCTLLFVVTVYSHLDIQLAICLERKCVFVCVEIAPCGNSAWLRAMRFKPPELWHASVAAHYAFLLLD